MSVLRRAATHPHAHPIQEVTISSSTQELRSFTVSTATAENHVLGRAAAVQAAKQMSRKTWRPVHVQRADERVSMRFRNGSLQEFLLETRRKRRS